MSTKSQSRTEEVAAFTSKRHRTPAENLQSRMVKRPLRVQTDLEAGSVKAIPTRKTVRRSNSDGKQTNCFRQEALESAGNMKRVQKHRSGVPAITLRDRARSFGLPSRHKYNLEAERTKHAQELVRIERAHNKDLTNVVKTLTEELS
ncbi:hypothetical protein EVAR_85559_1 [Eumeta japonica]|uniref:Uncharacterized protein n=1 Tax=Eumeta variegata TaxID=151549 RepID=A0A4C1VCQ3_EUMVA|nr:hypothetical protein EVAR_85559_1 [Eumeta japonica]